MGFSYEKVLVQTASFARCFGRVDGVNSLFGRAASSLQELACIGDLPHVLGNKDLFDKGEYTDQGDDLHTKHAREAVQPA